ncbi:MAG TPA: hypothetical protein P5121_09540 [Caldilineaceae bacterium]|nr:hypothetical protein [Caldilineaceae bacterium]
MWWRSKQRAAAEALLVALQGGAILKAHRTVDGAKVHKLHHQRAEPIPIDAAIVRHLEKRGLLRSNMKFPAATYLLTAKGSTLAQQVDQTSTQPLMARTPIH